MYGKHLTFKPSPLVADRIRALGRTEDVMFSPDQTRLAIAGFTVNRVLIIEIRIVTEDGTLTVQSEECVELLCPDFSGPHGVFWIDDGTLVVANRKKDVIVVPVPAVGPAGASVTVEPMLRLADGRDDVIKSPGSVAVARLSDQYFDFLVCNNYRHYVSRHIVQRRNGFEVISGHRLFAHELKVPDSISVSTDGALVAVSNHYGKRIDVFRNDSASGPHLPPAFSLGGVSYPHGVRFGLEDRVVLVADAGAPLVHVFARGGGPWTSAAEPVVSIKVMDDESFRRGQHNPEEGGPKGVDLLADGSLFVASCEEVPIAFFDFRAVRDEFVHPGSAADPGPRSDDAALLEASLAAMKGQREQIAALAAEVARMKAARDRSLDGRLRRMIRRAGQKILGPSSKY